MQSIHDRIQAHLSKRPEATAQEIALAVGSSPTYVHLVARKHGIRLWRAVPARKSSPPTSKVVTGGIVTPRSHRVCGTISELLVAADLMARGYEVYIPLARSIGHDIIAEAPSGALLTIEVRSAKRNVRGQLKYNKTTRSDILAAVVIGEIVHYEPELPE